MISRIINNIFVSRNFRHQQSNNSGNIQFYNWWSQRTEDIWLYRFVKNRGILEDTNKTICFCSVLGNRAVDEMINEGVKVFFTGENIHQKLYQQYADYMLDDHKTDLALGFDFLDNDRYLRFPLWVMYMFAPESGYDDIKRRCNELRFPQIGNRNKFAALISRFDKNGLRKEIYDSVSQIGRIDCPGVLLHNDDSLVSDFGDNKVKYLKQFVFNICPENSDNYGYVTEKCWQAIQAGCIPIYSGSCNKPEEGILNHNAIIFWNNGTGLETIRELHNDKDAIDHFLHQPRLLPDAEDLISEMFYSLESRLSSLLKQI